MTHCLRSLARGSRRATALGLTLLCSASTAAAAQDAAPAERLVVRGVHINSNEAAPSMSILIEDGRIVSVRADEAATPGARVIEVDGLYALPAFVDAFATSAIATATPDPVQDIPVDTGSDVRVEMREANRKGIQPTFNAASALIDEEAVGEPWRASGFGAVLAAPSGELLSGLSCVASTREAAARDRVIEAGVFAHAAFRASGQGYPGTLMAYHAQLRQFFWDAGRHEELVRRDAQGRPGPRPPYDLDLEAGIALINGEQRLLCEAETSRDVQRWLRLSDELGFRIAIAGGREIARSAEELATRGIPVILTLDWGDEPDDVDEEEAAEEEEAVEEQEATSEAGEATTEEAAFTDDTEEEAAEDTRSWIYEEPEGVRRERRRLWESEQRDTALRLHEAGVTLAFGTDGTKPKDLLKNVRALVEAGLPADVARRALTRGAAQLLGVDDRMGRIVAGQDATFALWTADPLEEDAQLAWIFVDGVAHEFEIEEQGAEGEGPSEGVDFSGDWSIAVTDSEDGETNEGVIELAMDEDGTLSGTFRMPSPMGEGELSTGMSGSVNADSATMSGTFALEGMSFDVEVDVMIDGDSMTGDALFRTPFGDREATVEATRDPGDAHELHQDGQDSGYIDDGHNHGHGHPNSNDQEQAR